jgi:hypothetical protein
MEKVRLCKCGCGKPLKQFKGEPNTNFAKREFIGKHWIEWRRNRPEGWHSKESRKKLTGEHWGEDIPKCDRCKLPIMFIRRDGFGITDKKSFCICDRKYDEKRRAWI